MKVHLQSLATLHICLLLFTASLFLPAMHIEHDYIDYGPSIIGYDVLLSGWGAILSGCPAWLANIFFVAAYISPRKLKLSTILSLLSVIFALTSYFYTKIWNDGDGAIRITSLASGFYFWLSALVLLTAIRYNKWNSTRANA